MDPDPQLFWASWFNCSTMRSTAVAGVQRPSSSSCVVSPTMVQASMPRSPNGPLLARDGAAGARHGQDVGAEMAVELGAVEHGQRGGLERVGPQAVFQQLARAAQPLGQLPGFGRDRRGLRDRPQGRVEVGRAPGRSGRDQGDAALLGQLGIGREDVGILHAHVHDDPDPTLGVGAAHLDEAELGLVRRGHGSEQVGIAGHGRDLGVGDRPRLVLAVQPARAERAQERADGPDRMAAAAGAAGLVGPEVAAGIAAHGVLEHGADLLQLVPGGGHRQAVAVEQVAAVEQHAADIDAGQADAGAAVGRGPDGGGRVVVEGDPVARHPGVELLHPAAPRVGAQHHLVHADQIERRIVMAERARHLVEHVLDGADADLVPGQLDPDPGRPLEGGDGGRQVLERQPVLLVDPDLACRHAPVPRRPPQTMRSVRPSIEVSALRRSAIFSPRAMATIRSAIG